MEKIIIKEFKSELQNEAEAILLESLWKLKELKLQKADVAIFYPELKQILLHKSNNVRWLAAEILGTPASLLKLQNAPVADKIKELEFLIDTTVPNMVQDRSERDIEYAMPALAALLSDEVEDVCKLTIETISAAQSDNQDFSLCLYPLIKVIAGNNDKLRLKAIFVLRSAVMSPYQMLDITEFLPVFTQYLSDLNNEIKWAVADMLTYFYTKSLQWEKVKELLMHADKDVRQEAAGTLTRVYSSISKLMPNLKKLLIDDSGEVRIVAARTLVYKAEKTGDTVEAIPVIVLALKHELEENRVYASSIIYTLISFYLEKRKKTDDGNAKHWKAVDEIIPDLENCMADTSSRVIDNLSKALVRYYLGRNKPEQVLHVFKNAKPETKDLIIKNIESLEIPKPDIVNSYIVEFQREKLIKKLEKDAQNQITEITLSARQFTEIKLIEIPKEVCNILSLKRLDVAQNSLKTLPDEIGNLVNLENLIATGNKLETLPPGIGKLGKLNYLWLYKNKLKTLPKEIGQLKGLKTLQLIQNKITKLPNEIGCLENLSDLDIQQNQLKRLPATIGNLRNLKRLDLRDNNLKNFPKEMENLQNLEQLMLDNNDLNEIPDFVFKLPKLSYLSFSFNKLAVLPVELMMLKNLEVLDLRYNQIKMIPPEIKQLIKLRVFDLSNNQLTSLPKELKLLTHLNFLHLRGNKLKIDAAKLRTGKASTILNLL